MLSVVQYKFGCYWAWNWIFLIPVLNVIQLGLPTACHIDGFMVAIYGGRDCTIGAMTRFGLYMVEWWTSEKPQTVGGKSTAWCALCGRMT